MLRKLCRARALLAEVDGAPRPIEDVARAVAISPSHFNRRFAAAFGVTPHQFRIHRRLERAKLLLAAGRHSVTEVCMEVGFSSLGSFSAQFARRVGATPSAYRRRLRALVQVPEAVWRPLRPGCLSLMAALPPAAFGSFEEAATAPLWQAPPHTHRREPR